MREVLEVWVASLGDDVVASANSARELFRQLAEDDQINNGVMTEKKRLVIDTSYAEADVHKGDTIKCWPGTRPGFNFMTTAESDPIELSPGHKFIRVTRTDLSVAHHDCIALTHIQVIHQPRTVQDTINIGMPYLRDSGIMKKLYHQDSCVTMRADGPCPCGVDGALRELAIQMSKLIDQYGTAH